MKKLFCFMGALCLSVSSLFAAQITEEEFALFSTVAIDIVKPYSYADAVDKVVTTENGAVFEISAVQSGNALASMDDDESSYIMFKAWQKNQVVYQLTDAPLAVTYFAVKNASGLAKNYAPLYFSLQGSNDFDGTIAGMSTATWTTLSTEGDAAATTSWTVGTYRYYSCNAEKIAYSAYRFILHGANGATTTQTAHAAIADIQLFSIPQTALRIENNLGEDIANGAHPYGLIVESDALVTAGTVSAATSALSEDGLTQYTLTGWKLYAESDLNTVLAEGTTDAANFIYTGDPLYLEWQYDAAVKVEALTAGPGELTIASDAEFLPAGESLAITATPAAGWHFYGWNSDCGSTADAASSSTTITLDKPGVLRALFLPEGVSTVDLYVSPTGSDTENHGFAAESSFATISNAVATVEAYLSGTVHVAAGTYAIDDDIYVTNAVSVVGMTGDAKDVVVSRNHTAKTRVARCFYVDHPDAYVANMTLDNGYINTDSERGNTLHIGSNGGTVENVIVQNGYNYGAVLGGAVYLVSDNALFKNSIIQSCTNRIAYQHGNTSYKRAPTALWVNKGVAENILVRDCVLATKVSAGKTSGTAVLLEGTGVLVNGTIVNCESGLSGGLITYGDDCTAYNTVIAGCKALEGATISTDGNHTITFTSEALVQSACIAEYPETIVNCATDDATAVNDTCIVGTLESFFLDATNGKFKPSALLENAGTEDVATGLPETDYAGNDRVLGLTVDIGYLEAPLGGTMIIVM